MAAMSTRSSSIAKPFSPRLSVGGSAGPDSRPLSPFLAVPKPHRLPREGPAFGGGRVQVMDRAFFEGKLCEAAPEGGETPLGLRSTRRPSGTGTGTGSQRSFHKHNRGSRVNGADGAASLGSTETPRTSAVDEKAQGEQSGKHRPLAMQERRQAELLSKFNKTEATREKDRKGMLERLERRKDLREARLKGLVESISQTDTLANKTAIDLRDRHEFEEKRRRRLHEEWEGKVYRPIAAQASEYLNPPDRLLEQSRSGAKSVDFTLPFHQFRLTQKVHEDPNRRSVTENARENAFHKTVSRMLGSSSSAPSLRVSPEAGKPRLVPLGLSRPVLEPTEWHQVTVQGAMFGHFAQVAEQGEGFKRARRGGAGVHVPDESDGVLAAGTRFHRTLGHCDRGVLHGSRASQGEGVEFKTAWGASSIAPAQDHFTYEVGAHATDIEFPKGKKMDPHFH